MNLLKCFQSCDGVAFLILVLLALCLPVLTQAALVPFTANTVLNHILAGGTRHSLALGVDGTAYAWGSNILGQLGDGTISNKINPIRLLSLTDVKFITSGADHSLVIRSGGTVWAWGHNGSGQLGNGTISFRQLVPTQVKVADGVGFLTGTAAVSAGTYHSLALKTDGTVWAWGFGALGDGTVPDVTKTTPVQVKTKGGGEFLKDVIEISAGAGGFSLALKADGTVWSWGRNDNAQLGLGIDDSFEVAAVQVRGPAGSDFLNGIVSISAGYEHTIALKYDGTVWGWGRNDNGQLGDSTFEKERMLPVQVSALTDVIAIAAGGLHSLALRSDGTVWAWGYNIKGQLGDDTSNNKSVPTKVLGLADIIAIAAGLEHSFALKADGTVWAWGNNDVGQLGDGTTINRLRPTQVLVDETIITPAEFWAEIKNAPSGVLALREDVGLDKSIFKMLPREWVVRVKKRVDQSGQNIDHDGHRWWQVEDVTDGTIGWMPANSLADGVQYLGYDPVAQSNLQKKTAEQLDSKEKRVPVVLEAVTRYHSNVDAANSLYGTSGGRDGANNFQKFIADSLFPKELILAIVVQESGGIGFDNEACSTAKDGGIGVMQITSLDFKGKGSGLDNYPRKNDCDARAGWTGTLSKYYSNALQGIYANIKDGFRVLQEKYRKKCPQDSITIDGTILSCQDIEKILTVWGYNGFARNPVTGEFTGNYLKDIADKLTRLAEYFAGVNYLNTDQFIEKLLISHRHKQVIRLYSPALLQIYDTQNKVTGPLNNEVREEIPNSLYEQDREAAVILFPTDDYRYRIIGTSEGTYGLSIDATRDASTTSFAATDIPTALKTVHEYSINWEALSRDEKGVTVQVDKEGDGVFDYQFQTSTALHDTTPPHTQIIITGTVGNNHWFVSDVLVTLAVSDNEDGVGVLLTEYSLDGGATWNVYSSPIPLSVDGIYSLQYRSRDFLGNIEEVKTVEIKIDKTPPEAILFFDPDTQTLAIEGTDNLTQSAVTRYHRFSLIRDEAGNTTTVVLEMHKDNRTLTVEIRGLQYNAQYLEPARAELSYEWSLPKKENVIRTLKQEIETRRQFEIRTEYRRRENITEVEIQGLKNERQQLRLDGLIIIQLITEKGRFLYKFL